jgi:hypothetical protein
VVTSITLLIGLATLWFDLSNDGLVEDLLWNVTGETEPLEQLLGASQYLANATRQTPEVQAGTDIQHIPQNPFGVNAFIELESDPEKRERSMQLIDEAGFGWLRQHFTWEDIEIYGRNNYWDGRNDHDGDGQKDLISSWAKYDQIVALAEEYEVNILARVSGPTPRWALPSDTTNTHARPENIDDYVNYATAVAERYQGQIRYYQIWNEPNLGAEWVDGARWPPLVDPEAYTEMLCKTHDALKGINPEIVIVTGAIGPTIALSGYDAYDALYLQRMYDFGAGDCFDVLSTQGYGLFSGPTDRRLRPYTMNFARHTWLRDVMVANGDAHKPIWLSEAAWNPVPDDPNIIAPETFGQVTPEQAAEWAPLAYERAQEDWPWVGVINYWYLKRPDEREVNQPFYYFRLVEPDFEPTPTYFSLQAYIQSGEWRQPDQTWSTRARERLPQVLVGGLGVLFTGYVLASALWIRIFGRNEDRG